MTKPTLIQPPKPLTEDQVAMADVLKDLLALCLEGKIDGIGIVALQDGGFFSVWGGNVGGVNLGLDDLKDRILKAGRASADEKMSRRSSIIRN